MINNTTRHTLYEGVNLHLVQSDKFKTVLFGIYIKRPLQASEVALNALLSRVLDKATDKYRTQRQMNQALDLLYGALFVTDVHKYGEKQMIQVKIQVPVEKFVEDETVYAQVLSLFNDMIHAPLKDGNGFDPELVSREKVALIDEIKSRRDQKDSWTISRCIEVMCAEEPYSIHELGVVEQVEAITPVELLAHLNEIWASSEIDICIIGDYEPTKMVHLIKEHVTFVRGDLVKTEREQVIFDERETIHYAEAHDITQGKLCLGYRMNIPYESKLYKAALLSTFILGGGGSSKLFKNIREKEALCYSIFARTEKFKSIMLIYAGVDFEKMDLAERLIIEEVQKMQAGDISDEELEIARKALISNLRAVSDYSNSYINIYYNFLLTENSDDFESYIEHVKGITKADVIQAIGHFKLDTVVRLTEEAHHVI